MEVGGRYYVISHAYFHYVGRVTEITGKNRCRMTELTAVHACGRPWTKFFADGFKDDTNYDSLPDGDVNVLNYFDWKHPIPRKT